MLASHLPWFAGACEYVDFLRVQAFPKPASLRIRPTPEKTGEALLPWRLRLQVAYRIWTCRSGLAGRGEV
jgi:hypothetical protein